MLARDDASPRALEALESLCRSYWYPLYSFTRQQGFGPEEAADLTQDFFQHLIATKALRAVQRDRGRFRSFLLASLKNLLANHRDRVNCLKRGGGAQLLSLDEEAAEARFQSESLAASTPDRIFDRAWAETILSRALERLRAECDGVEKTRRFDELKVFLVADKGTVSLGDAAAKLNLSLTALKAMVHRLRKRFGELIREEIAQTVASPDEVEEEIRYLFMAFAS